MTNDVPEQPELNESVKKCSLLKQPTFYFVCVAFCLFVYAQWPKTKTDSYIQSIGDSEYQIDFIKKPNIENVKERDLWLYSASVSGVKFAVRFQQSSPNLTLDALQKMALSSFDQANQTFEFVVSEPAQYEKGFFWSVSDEKGRVRESLWVLDKKGWMEIITIFDNNKKGHEELAIAYSDSLSKF
ncbi:hypothetical protein [Marinicellulosiphila megalodicopiae]|uniref:hypothetical protein n=1 Tax=Marinicellulosiphila megalodicopiae TaxID=2724896 RepID=UPI003BB1A578